MKKEIFSNTSPRKKAWMLTLTDLMMLMLTFFILLYSMSTPASKNDNAFFKGISLDEYPVYSHGVHLNYLGQILAQKIKNYDGYRINQEQGILYIQIPKKIFEDAKNRVVSVEDKKRIESLGEQLNNIPNKIFLQVSQSIQPTQEALLEASVVANLLKQGGYPFNLRIVQQKDSKNEFIQIVIFPNARSEL